MNIVLAEIAPNGEQLPERSFSQSVVLVGRDASECDVAFDKARFPMVSRKHAELRWQNGTWYVVDLNSSYGTYINGRPVVQPTPLSAGTSVQFGTDGPTVYVVWFEQGTEPAGAGQSDVVLDPSEAPRRKAPVSERADTDVNVHQTPAMLKFADPSQKPFAITKNDVWLGREANCDIVFDSSSGTVSRRHASICRSGGQYVVADNNSFNGTFVNEHRITAPVRLYNDDEIRLGLGGPVLRFNSPSQTRPTEAPADEIATGDTTPKTIVYKLDKAAARKPAEMNTPQLMASVPFAGKSELIVGRDASCDIQLDGLQISKRHAQMLSSASGVTLEDLNSTNGVFVNGMQISRSSLGVGDVAQIGPFLLKIDDDRVVAVFDTRSKTRVDAVNLTCEVKGRVADGAVKLIDGISVSIKPNEFVGILGPSGAGKSTLIEAMNGARPASAGNVLVNNLDLYRNFDSLKQQIGYVPQEDIIHRELSVYKTLYYIAKLRLSTDVSPTEVRQIVDEVLDMTGLTDRKDVAVDQLSGGQRKRVSMAVELLTKPSVIFLDEPTSGLDPLTEEKIMTLFRQVAESGRTVVMTTHAMENVGLFDKIVLLLRGKLVFYGTPEDALKHFGVASFTELYHRLERSEDPGLENSPAQGQHIAEDLRQKFQSSQYYFRNVHEPLSELGTLQPSKLQKKRRLGIFGGIRQWITLSSRYFAVLFKDKLNLFILFAQAPLIALLTFIVVDSRQPRDFIYFVIALVAFWFGISIAAREIIRERAVYKRERMFNLGLVPYLMSKLTVLGIVVSIQCAMLFVPLKILDVAGVMSMPGELFGVPQFWAMLLTAGVGVAGGLFVSTLLRTSEMATSIVPLILIPQILFSGIVGVPQGINKVVGLAMPSAWSFDTMKRFSTLDTLEPEGADPKRESKGLGLYRWIEVENEKAVDGAKRGLEDLKKAGGGVIQPADIPTSALPEMPVIRKIPEDLSSYVSFLHPWMDEVLNQIVLMLMLGILVVATLVALRLRDFVH